MATNVKSRARRSRRFLTVAKPSGSLHPRVQKVGPEHFGIVAVDCAKARSKWMLADFYGRVLVPPTVVEHTRAGFDRPWSPTIREAVAQARPRATSSSPSSGPGIYHLPVKRAFAARRLEARIVHPLTTKQFRLPADPGNKTDDTDLCGHPPRRRQRLRPARAPARAEIYGPTPAAGPAPPRPGRKNGVAPQSDPSSISMCSCRDMPACFDDIFDAKAPLLIARERRLGRRDPSPRPGRPGRGSSKPAVRRPPAAPWRRSSPGPARPTDAADESAATS